MDLFKPLKTAANFLRQKAARDVKVDSPATFSRRNYRSDYQSSYWQKRPPFSITWADLMMVDHQVAFGMSLSNAVLKLAEVEVVGGNDLVNKFVQEQWQRIWDEAFRPIALTRRWGFCGYEVMYRHVEGKIEFDRLVDHHPWNTRPLIQDRRLYGVSFGGLDDGVGNKRLPTGASLWLSFRAKGNSFFGDALLETPFAPWYEKTMESGAVRMRQLRMVKDAWIGDQIIYDETFNTYNPDGTIYKTGMQMAFEAVVNRSTGGTLCFPGRPGVDGKLVPLIEYKGPTPVSGATQIMEWVHDLDADIFDGIEVPKEVVEAATTGSGFSGRSIPFIAFCNLRDLDFGEDVRQIKKQVMDPLVCANFGALAAQDYTIKPKPLMETVGALMGPMGKPDTQDGGGPPQQDRMAGGPDQGELPQQIGQKPQQFSETPAEVVEVKPEPEAEQFSVVHAPAGGATVAGKKFKGGEFIPGDVLAKASPAEKAALKAGGKEKPAEQSPATAQPKSKRAPVPQQEPTERTKSEIAKASAKRVDKSIQRYAEEYNEPRFAKAMGGVSFPDSEPVDVVVGESGVVKHGIELKTLVDNGNGKLTMDKYAQVRKIEWEKKNKGATYHTIVSDDSGMYDAATGQPKEGGSRKYYYRRGIAGSARIGAMHECRNEAELKKLMALPENKLPPAAQRTDRLLRVGTWKFFQDEQGKGYRNSKTGDIARAKK